MNALASAIRFVQLGAIGKLATLRDATHHGSSWQPTVRRGRDGLGSQVMDVGDYHLHV